MHRYGSFPLSDGTRRRRFRCRCCGRTFHSLTGTALYYLKKRDRWAAFLQAVAQRLTLRQSAAFLDVHIETAFRWRHRLLLALCCQAQPRLTGHVAATEAYISYSEKGSRTTNGTGAYGTGRRRWCDWNSPSGRACGKPLPRSSGGGTSLPHRLRSSSPLFRRFKDGKPTCVLLAGAGEQRVITMISQGRPAPEQLQARLSELLGDGTELWAHPGMLPYVMSCHQLGFDFRDMGQVKTPGGVRPLYQQVDRLRAQLHGWLGRFHGVATRYLDRYLAWYRLASGPAGAFPQAPTAPRAILR